MLQIQRFVCVALAGLLIAGASQAQQKTAPKAKAPATDTKAAKGAIAAPKIEVVPETKDAGVVAKGHVIETTFVVKNNGGSDLIITDARPGCGCTVASFDKVIKPGGEGNTYVWGVMLSGGTLYATDMLSGFWALDPATLATKGGGNNVPERYGSDLWVFGNVAYSGGWGRRTAAGVSTPGNAVKIWNLTVDGGVPTLADSLIIPNITTISDVAVTPDGKMLVVTAEGGGGNGLYIFNRSGPAKPMLVATYQVSQGLHTGEVAVINGRTYVFAARDPAQQQMDIFDITGLVP